MNKVTFFSALYHKKLHIQICTNDKGYSTEILQGINRNSMVQEKLTLKALRKTSKKCTAIILKYKEGQWDCCSKVTYYMYQGTRYRENSDLKLLQIQVTRASASHMDREL